MHRRDFLTTTAAASVLAGGSLRADPSKRERLRVAALLTAFFYRSHAHVILENFLEPYLFNGKVVHPDMDVVALYVDQFPPNDMAREVAWQYGIPIYPTIKAALCRGGDRLAVDAVLSIGEHGNYPVNAKGQKEYPRKRYFDEIVKVLKASGRVVPVFNDKHLSYRWDWAKEMYETAMAMGIPLMAGSSVPLAERRPPLEIPMGAKIEEAVAIHGGDLELYDFHGLELLQSFVESRTGGEAGIQSVQFVTGDRLWKAADEGAWSAELAADAMSAEVGRQDALVRMLGSGGKVQPKPAVPMHAILLRYRDGLRAAVLKIGESVTRWNLACRMAAKPEIRATSLYVGPWDNRNLFKALCHAIQAHFRERKSPYPVERTLLTTGALDRAMDSRMAGGNAIATPELAVKYQPEDFRAMREMGATWKIITDRVPQPRGIGRVGA